MTDKLNDFFEQRPAVTVVGFARECGVSHQYIDYIRLGKSKPSEKLRVKIIEVMQKYGY
jgi:DNA-binding LacI/PurR family transcriptional regulator